MSKLIRGSLLITVATFLSKFLGLIYLIPFNAMVGKEGGTLYNYAYVPYNIMLSIATIGIPLAMSKTVSKYNALGDYATGRRAFKHGTILMLFTGFVAFLILFLGADLLANAWIVDSDPDQAITADQVALVIRAVSFALIIIPAMSVTRGFFQGHESMGPSALSTVTEQIARIVFVLVSVFVVIVILDGTIAVAVAFATFGAFVGAVGSWIVLILYWRKRKPYLDRYLEQQVVPSQPSTKEIFREMLGYAGPFIIVGLATSLYQLVDLFTFDRAMAAAGYGETEMLGVINTYAHKIVIIPGTIATGMSLAILPALTRTYAQKNKEELYKQINQALQIVLVLVIPAVVGIAALSDVFYASLYGMDDIEITGSLLGWYAPVGLFFALFTVSASVLQGINQQNFTVLSLMAGLLAKILLNAQLIQWFGPKGIIFGTGIAVIIAVAINLSRLKTAVDFPFREIRKRSLLILIFSVIMALVIFAVKGILGIFIPYETSHTGSIIVLLAGVLIGGGVYLWLAYVSTLLHHVFGDEVPIIDRLLRKLRR